MQARKATARSVTSWSAAAIDVRQVLRHVRFDEGVRLFKARSGW